MIRKLLWLLTILLVVTLVLPSSADAASLHSAKPALASGSWGVGNFVGLCKDTHIRVGPGLSYTAHTTVPVNDWTVKVIGGPTNANGQSWWDTSRFATGDPSGGTGWVSQDEFSACPPDDGGGHDGGDGGATPPLQLLSVVPSRSIAEFNQGYFLLVSIYNPASKGQGGGVQVSESGTLTSRGDTTFSTGMSVFVNAGETKTVQIGPIRHAYNWAKEDTQDCGNLQKAFFELPKEKILDYAEKIHYGEIPAIYGVNELIINLLGFKTDNTYSYNVVLDSNNQSQSKSTNVTVYVSRWKINQYLVSLAFDQDWPKWSVVGIGALWTPAAPTAPYLLSNEVFVWQGSCSLKANALDPDPNYRVVAQPSQIVVPSTIAELPDGPEKQVSLDYLRFITDLEPLNTSLGRYEGANADDEMEWAAVQLRAARKYAATLVYDLNALKNSTATISGETAITPEIASLAQNYLATNGLPAAEKALLAERGLSSSEIQQVQETLLASIPAISETQLKSEDVAKSMISVYQDTIDYLNTSVSEVNGQLVDAVAPTSNIQLQATSGNNGWLVSDVTVTISASDNTGGSGVKAIEWSLDDGRSWNAYNGTFVHSKEGMFHLIARAIDNEGNIEYPPSSADFKVDKTAPVVKTWTDNDEYTRVQPLVIHFSGYDPMPGSGLMTLTGSFMGKSVNDGQVIDMFWFDLGTYTVSVYGEDYAGWKSNAEASFPLIATLESLGGTVNRLCSEGYITNLGVCNSLRQKIDAATDSRNRGLITTAQNQLNALQMEVQAQANKHVKPEAVHLLMMDSNYIINNIAK